MFPAKSGSTSMMLKAVILAAAAAGFVAKMAALLFEALAKAVGG
jgi:hypothetical protein